MNWKEDMLKKIEEMTAMSVLLKEISKQRPKSTKEFNHTLIEMVSFLEFLQTEMPTIFKKWESKK
jgi:hypothetical protein